MDMFNKLKNTVSGVLPVGNPVTREYDVRGHVASGGPGLLWKIYDASNRNTKQEASVFLFEKKTLERYSKRDRELILEMLKRGVSQLTRLRHPNILSVLHPIEESRESLAFATEPVFCSLANALGSHDNMPNPLPPDLEGFKLYDVEIKYGLFQLCEGVCFLHNSVKLVHGNLCPHSVVINKTGAWKIAGFDFCIPNANTADQMPYYPHKEWRTDIPPLVQPQLNYLAPEYALTMSCETASDMYSVGVLFYALFNYGKALFDSRDDLSTYQGNVEGLRRLKLSVLGSVPEEVREHIGLLLNTEPSVRPDADQLGKIPFFEDVGSMTLQYLDSLFQRDNLQKSQFFKGLPKVLEKLPKRVNLKRVLPCLYSECVNKDMVPFVLPCVLLIAESASDREYVRHILPGIVPLFKLKEPIQILLIFMQNMTLLLQKTPQSDIKTHVLPMVYGALESPSPQIQDLCLNIIPTFASLVDFSSMKNSLIPRIRKLCLTTSLLNVRVTCLICIGKLLEYMDKWYVLDDILPIMPDIPSREPAVLMGILGIYKVALTHKKLGITKDVLANKVIPFLFPIAIDNNLNLQQFSAFMSVIKEMMEKVECEHRAKLEQLASMQSEQRTIQISSSLESTENKSGKAAGSGQDTMMDKFMSGFGLSSYFGASTGDKSELESIDSSKLSNGSAMNSVPQPKVMDTKLPNQPAKVSLTLEEKTRLARQQQQQQRLKSQPSLQATPNTGAKNTTSANTHNTQVKDLTSSLLNSNFMATPPSSKGYSSGGVNSSGGFGSSASTVKPNYSVNSGGMAGSASSTNSYSSQPNWSSKSTMGGFNTAPTQPIHSGGFNTAPTQPMTSSDIDVSAFDSLLPGKNTNKSTLNQMSPQPQKQPMQQNFGRPMGMSPGSMQGGGGVGGMGFQASPMGMQQQQQGMMGSQTGSTMMSSGGMMGNQGMMGMMGGGQMMSPQKPPAQSKPLSSNDIDDLLS